MNCNFSGRHWHRDRRWSSLQEHFLESYDGHWTSIAWAQRQRLPESRDPPRGPQRLCQDQLSRHSRHRREELRWGRNLSQERFRCSHYGFHLCTEPTQRRIRNGGSVALRAHIRRQRSRYHIPARHGPPAHRRGHFPPLAKSSILTPAAFSMCKARHLPESSAEPACSSTHMWAGRQPPGSRAQPLRWNVEG